MTAVEYILNLVVGEDEQGKDVRVKDTISKSEIAKAKEMEKEKIVRAIDNVYFDKDGNEMTGEEYYNTNFKLQ